MPITEQTPVAEVTLTQSPGTEVAIPKPLTEVSTFMRSVEPEVTSQARLSPQGGPSSAESRMSSGEHVTALSQALLAQQVPPLPIFSGEGNGEEETFAEWHEQLELVANMCELGDQVKLISVATRPRGQCMLFTDSVLTMNEPVTIFW